GAHRLGLQLRPQLQLRPSRPGLVSAPGRPPRQRVAPAAHPGLQPSFALAQASTVWYVQVVLIVLGHVIAVFLAHLRAGERFQTAQRALLSQYPMLLLMVLYTMTSLWILAQPITREAG